MIASDGIEVNVGDMFVSSEIENPTSANMICIKIENDIADCEYIPDRGKFKINSDCFLSSKWVHFNLRAYLTKI